MTDIKRHLRQGDPLVNENESGLSPAGAANMRRAILAAVVEDAPRSVAWWPRPFVMAAAVAACLAAGVGIGLRFDPGRGSVGKPSAAQAGVPGARRQLQFVTTGGTRVIWTFDENFEL